MELISKLKMDNFSVTLAAGFRKRWVHKKGIVHLYCRLRFILREAEYLMAIL
ncbi:hypothetical protein LguiA_013571 [Lonicera macranthoides]